MKKTGLFLILICSVLLMQSLCLTAFATESQPGESESVSTQESVEETTPKVNATFGNVCVANGCRTIDGMVSLISGEYTCPTARGVFVFEKNTGTVVYSHNPDLKMSPGTLIKIVTALVAIENCELDEVVTAKDAIQSRVPGSAQRMSPQLKSGEQMTVEDLLHSLLLDSANDAAVALAEHVAGTTEAYKQMMNDRVKQIGCTNTEFGNISGIDNVTHYSTARDMARIVLEATSNETFVKVWSAEQYTIPATNMTEEERKIKTENYLISDLVLQQFKDPRVNGGLAAYHPDTGAGLVCTTDYKDMELVCVILGATREYMEDPSWMVKTYGNFNEMNDMVQYIYDNCKVNRVIYEGQALRDFSVANGESAVVGQPMVSIDSVLKKDTQLNNLNFKYSVTGGGMQAPVAQDQKIATVEVWYRNSCLMEAELFAMSDVKRTDESGVTIHGVTAQGRGNGNGLGEIVGLVCILFLVPLTIYLVYNNARRLMARKQRRRRRTNRRRSR